MDSQPSLLLEASSQEPSTPLVLAKKGTHILWDRDHHKKFMEWWATTPYATSHNGKEHPNLTSTKRKAKLWSTITQCAEVSFGKPVMESYLCNSLLEHPQLIVNGQITGNSALDWHFKDSRPLATKGGSTSTPLSTPSKV
jgi:hypothetical protein